MTEEDDDQPTPPSAVQRWALVTLILAGIVMVASFIYVKNSERPAPSAPPAPNLPISPATQPQALATTEPEAEYEIVTVPEPADQPPAAPQAAGSTLPTVPPTSPRPTTRRIRRRIARSASSSPTTLAFVPGDGMVIAIPQPAPAPAAGGNATGAAHITFTPDGRLLVVTSDGTVETRDVNTGQRRAIGVNLGGGTSLSFSGDGKSVIAVGAGGDVRMLDPNSWQTTLSFASGVAGLTGGSFSTDGRTIALAGSGGLALYDIPDKKVSRMLIDKEACPSAAFSADGRQLAVATAGGVALFETQFWQKQATLGASATQLKFWPARAALVVVGGDRTIGIYDLATKQSQASLSGYEGDIADVAVSSDGRTIAACGASGVMIWDAGTRIGRKLP